MPGGKYFEMSLQYFEEKNIFLSKCLFIALTKYCARKCLVWVLYTLYKPLKRANVCSDVQKYFYVRHNCVE